MHKRISEAIMTSIAHSLIIFKDTRAGIFLKGVIRTYINRFTSTAQAQNAGYTWQSALGLIIFVLLRYGDLFKNETVSDK